ncbi:hypothetical protein [Paenilisteria weihenstephanensis]|nr:hypothetical protein [Listeria weihenstephanensis]
MFKTIMTKELSEGTAVEFMQDGQGYCYTLVSDADIDNSPTFETLTEAVQDFKETVAEKYTAEARTNQQIISEFEEWDGDVENLLLLQEGGS